MHDLIIIGGGPAGAGAGVYAGRKKLKTLLITDSFGGQSLVSAGIENWIGTKLVSGYDLSKMLEDHVRSQKDVEIIDGVWVKEVKKADSHFVVTASDNKSFETKAVLLTTGSRRKKLNVPGEKELDGKGVAYCSTCDAPLFKNKTVAVVGGGNAGLEAVLDLMSYAAKIYLLGHGEAFKGDPVTLEKVKKSSKVEMIVMAETREIIGDKFVTGLKYEDLKTGDAKELSVGGVFVEIGAVPNSEIIRGLAELNKYGEVVIDHKTQATSVSGIWAAGDVSDVLYKQNNISVGDAIKAVLNIVDFLNKNH